VTPRARTWAALFGALVAGAGALAWNKHRIVEEDAARRALDEAAARAYHKIEDLVGGDAGPLPEPTYVSGKVLPVAASSFQVTLGGVVYDLLPEAIRARDDAEASTVAVVVTKSSALYMASGGPGHLPGIHGSISHVTVTFVDLPHHAVLGQKDFRQDPPPATATEAELDAYSNRFWEPVASYVAALPRR
jgi:hypothetical protein